MACPLSRTEDGLEMQKGKNHFGHTHQSTPSVTAKGGPGTQGNNLLNLNSLPTVLN